MMDWDNHNYNRNHHPLWIPWYGVWGGQDVCNFTPNKRSSMDWDNHPNKILVGANPKEVKEDGVKHS